MRQDKGSNPFTSTNSTHYATQNLSVYPTGIRTMEFTVRTASRSVSFAVNRMARVRDALTWHTHLTTRLVHRGFESHYGYKNRCFKSYRNNSFKLSDVLMTAWKDRHIVKWWNWQTHLPVSEALSRLVQIRILLYLAGDA